MEQATYDQIETLVTSLREVLESYCPIDRGRQVMPIDAFFAYRFLLDRNPDPDRELPNLLTSPQTFSQFLSAVLNSDEFSNSSRFFPPHRILMAEVEEFRFWFDTGDREMGVRMALGLYESRSVELMKDIVVPGMRCIDVGAQTGFFTCLLASRVGASGKVYAFEPMPKNYALLSRNIEENRFGNRTRTFSCAASDTTGTITGSSISDMYVVGQVEGTEQVDIEAVRVDDIVQEPVDLIKIDVEGHEPAALRGMEHLIEHHKPIIISEVNEFWLQSSSNSSGAEYVSFLRSFGYDVFDIRDLEQPLIGNKFHADRLEVINLVAIPVGSKRGLRIPSDSPNARRMGLL